MDAESLPYRPCVGVMLINRDGLIFTGNRKDSATPAWQMPQGGIDEGEDPADAALRELREETGVEARLIGLIDVVDGLFPEGRHYVLIDFAAEWLSGEPVAGDDAAEAAFVPLADALSRVAWSETRRIIQAAVRLRDSV